MRSIRLCCSLVLSTAAVLAAVVMIAMCVPLVAAAPSSHRLRAHPPTFTPRTAGAAAATAGHIQGQDRSGWSKVVNPHGGAAAAPSKWSIPLPGGTLTTGAFTLDLTVGTGAAQATFAVVVDTGSSNTAVPSVGCASCGQTSGFYNASASPTAQRVACDADDCRRCTPGGAPVPLPNMSSSCAYGPARCTSDGQCGFAVSYGGSNTFISGSVGRDVACVGGPASSASAACAPIFLDAITSQFPQGNLPNGIIGLAYPDNACNPTCQPTFLDSLVANGTLAPDEDKFGMCLSKQSGGVLDLGFFNSSRARGGEAAFQWTPIVKEHWYNIRVLAMAVGDHDTGVPAEAFGIWNDAIGSFVDSGTGILIMSPAAFGALSATFQLHYPNCAGLTALFSGQSAVLTDDEVGNFPSIHFTVGDMSGSGNFTVSVRGSSYLMAAGNPTHEMAPYTLGIAGVPSIGLILGDVVMQDYYIAFDRAGKRLGFAPILEC